MISLVELQREPWSVFDELESFHSGVNRALARGGTWQHGSGYPHMDVWSSDEGIEIDAELPGVNPEDVDVSVMDDELTLRGKVDTGESGEGESYYRRERPAGEFSRTLQLPFRVDAEAVKATYKNGVLHVSLPRSEAEKPKKIAIECN